jgi:uncharacterized membrane protein YdcZ (DUF606 family)
MRFEVRAAYVMGIGLPLLEALRRRTNFENLPGYVDDFIAGGLLLYAAHAVTRGRRSGRVLLAVAWAVLCGGLYGSFFWQLSSAQTHDVGGLPNTTVVIIKGVLYAIALAGLVSASRTAIGSAPALQVSARSGRRHP